MVSRPWWCILVLLSILSLSKSSILPQRQSFELEIHRAYLQDAQNSCQLLSLRESTQPHKKLAYSKQDYIVESRQFHHHNGVGQSQMDYVRFYSYDKSILLPKALSLCGHPSTWSFPVLGATEADFLPARYFSDGDQDTFTSSEPTGFRAPSPPPMQITPIISSGPSSNRVDLVFLSDGYMEEERDKFIEDSTRLAQDISNNETFSTVQPLLNFWAAFSPSNESGIGIGGRPKDTPYGLYRDGTELRGVYYSKPEIAHAACFSMGDQCDYPILLGNDPFYGGLGGRFTVTTSSIINGALVLRHELGHSIINEGEEYDGGFAYYGPNAAHQLSEPFPWAHWLTENVSFPRAERSVMPIQEYPWTLLNTSTPWNASFNSSGTYSRYVVRFSLSGIPEEDHLKVELDGVDLRWTPRKDVGIDRWHYDIHRNASLQEGEHVVSFTMGPNALAGKAQLCSMEIIEFGSPDDFNGTEGFIGAFPTFSETNETTYRPTNEGCLMRVVTSPNLCAICVEGLWHALLQRVELIDGIQTGCHLSKLGNVSRTIEASLIPLAQFRNGSNEANEAYSITWRKDDEVLQAFANKSRIEVENVRGNYTIEVNFTTEEVRLDTQGYLMSKAEVVIEDNCIVGE